ncbi:MAG: hypothetical protein LIO46_07775, partial [Clostridiales bacterium]|nr:hypothetical protein [Clostridiales bacterium]
MVEIFTVFLSALRWFSVSLNHSGCRPPVRRLQPLGLFFNVRFTRFFAVTRMVICLTLNDSMAIAEPTSA